MTTDYYEILGVSRDADKSEIKSAFRRKAAKLHPDVNKAPDAEERFKELGKAYETLSDDEKRAMYDRYGEEGLQNAGYSSNFDFGFGNLNDIFDSFFGGGFSSRAEDPNAPRRGSDLRINIELEFEEAVFGTEKEIKISHSEVCENCKGTGAAPGAKVETCKTCGGTGKVKHVSQTMFGNFAQITVCPDCKGKGKKVSELCKECKGSGTVEREKTLKVRIPAGVDNLSKIRLSGEGDAGENGGMPGDLYIVVYVKAHKEFERKGADIFSALNVSFPQAALGAKVSVKTLDGEAQIEIPSGTENDKILTIRNAGVPFAGEKERRGNHYVVVKLVPPKNLTPEEKSLYEQLLQISEAQKPENKGIFEKVKNVLNKK